MKFIALEISFNPLNTTLLFLTLITHHSNADNVNRILPFPIPLHPLSMLRHTDTVKHCTIYVLIFAELKFRDIM